MENSLHNLQLVYLQGVEEEHVMQLKSNIINFMSYNDTNEVVDERFSRYKSNLFKSTRKNDQSFHKVNFTCGNSYMDSQYWQKRKKQE